MSDQNNYVKSLSGLEEDFTGGGIHSLSQHRGTTKDAEMDKKICELVDEWGEKFNKKTKHELIEELLITAYKINADDLNVADLKLINRTLKEMRIANKTFKQYRNERKVSVYGSARTAPEEDSFKLATEFSKRMKEHKFMTITGAGDGIMGAAQMGAGRDYSFGLNINLPFEQGANDVIEGDHKLISFNYFFTRKLSFVKESHAIALFPGGLGTMDECFEMLTLIQTGKTLVVPVIMVDRPGGKYWSAWQDFIQNHLLRLKLISESDLNLFLVTDSMDKAIHEIVNFYNFFHSYRIVKDKISIRLNKSISEEKLENINSGFKDLLKSGGFTQQHALTEEKNEPNIERLPRIVGSIKFGNYGLLRKLIDEINKEY